jgi:hypothetical protein
MLIPTDGTSGDFATKSDEPCSSLSNDEAELLKTSVTNKLNLEAKLNKNCFVIKIYSSEQIWIYGIG